MLEHVGALLRIELLENVGDVGRMKFIKTGVGNGKLHVGKIAVEQVHVVPRDDLLIEWLAKELAQLERNAFDPGGQPAQNATNAHFGTEQAQLRTRGGKLEVIYAHDLHALRVDDLAVEQIAGEQNLIGLKVAEADASLIDFELDAIVGDVFDVLAP